MSETPEDWQRSDIPHEFRPLPDLRQPFACRSPPEGWPSEDAHDVLRDSTEYTLIFPVDREQRKVLLGLKRRGMGVDLYNGFGGKVESGETVAQCAARELEEESGLASQDSGLYYKGWMFSCRPRSSASSKGFIIIKIHFFACVAWTGFPVTTEEMIPKWFPIPSSVSVKPRTLPIDRMWPEANFYLLPMLQSILRDERSKIFLARIDYRYMSRNEAPTALPAIERNTIRTALISDQSDGAAERLCSWWMTLSTVKDIHGTTIGCALK